MKISVKIIFLIFIAVSLFMPAWLFSEGDNFNVAGLQYRIDFEDYSSREDFFRKIDNSVGEICSDHKIDLIIFPEYIGVFYQLIKYNDIIRVNESFQSALISVLAANPQFAGMADVFLAGTDDLKSYIDGWSEISRKYGVSIIAGSCFASDSEGGLRNRSFVFNEDGRQIYYQDKVYLTDFEKEIIGLSPARLEDASFFRISGKNIVMTICRDAYARDWEEKNSGAFLWVDIKANGEVFNSGQRQSFLRALPSRLFYSDVNYGITVCAVGRYLDLFWEGESSAIRKDGSGLYLAAAAASSNDSDTVFFSIPLR